MYELNKRDKAAIRAAALLGPHSAAAVRKMLIKEGNARLKMDRRMEMLMSGSQAAEDMILAEDAMEEDAMEKDKRSLKEKRKWADDESHIHHCCVCNKSLPQMHWPQPNTGTDHGEECYFCDMPTCLECIDHDAPHAIGNDELEGETVCKSCCEKQVKLRDDKDQDDEDDSIAEAEDHPS